MEHRCDYMVWVWRIGNNYVFVGSAHNNESDCLAVVEQGVLRVPCFNSPLLYRVYFSDREAVFAIVSIRIPTSPSAGCNSVDMDDSALHYTVTPGEKSRTDCHRRRRINVIGGDRYRTRRILCPSNFQLLLIILVRIGSLHSSLFRTMTTLFFRNSVTRRGDLCISFMYCF